MISSGAETMMFLHTALEGVQLHKGTAPSGSFNHAKANPRLPRVLEHIGKLEMINLGGSAADLTGKV